MHSALADKPPEEGLGRRLWVHALFPALLYFLLFCLLTWPLIGRFSTHYFTDQADGLSNIWNLWWVNKAVTQLRVNPWQTNYFHYPHGVNLIGHSLNPLNCLIALPLLRTLSLTETHNAIIVHTFVVGGVTMYCLARYVTGAYWPSLAAGYLYTFSSYHFSHAEGHMNLTSLQWLPLFVLFWLRLLDHRRTRDALGAAFSLGLVILCDYYYFFVCVLIAVLMTAWRGGHERYPLRWLTGIIRRPLLTFMAAALVVAAPMAVALVVASAGDPYALGGHPPELFSLDLFGWIIPGGHWRFNSLTSWFWNALPGVIHESSVHLGVGFVALALIGYGGRVRMHKPVNGGGADAATGGVEVPDRGFWLMLGTLFLILAMGPAVQIFGKPVTRGILPYAWLEQLLPIVKLGGVPVRYIIATLIAASILAAGGLSRLWARGDKGRMLAVALFALAVFETVPTPIPQTQLAAPGWVKGLNRLPDREPVLNLVSDFGHLAYWQVLYDRPQAFGFLARTPRSIKRKNSQLLRMIHRGEARRMYADFGLRYLIVVPGKRFDVMDPSPALVFRDAEAEVYDLKALSRLPAREPLAQRRLEPLSGGEGAAIQ